MKRSSIASLAVLVASFLVAPPVGAHRLDECLQAMRVSIDIDKISLDIDLTPGASVAARVFAGVDSDHDGEMSDEEMRAFAERVLDSIALSVDGRPTPVRLVSHRFPTLREMRLGVGIIHLSAQAAVPPAVGVHHVSYVNSFLPDLSVYLANALVPSDNRVHIGEQRRDFLQRSLTVDYRVTASRSISRIGWSVTLFAMIGTLVVARRTRSLVASPARS